MFCVFLITFSSLNIFYPFFGAAHGMYCICKMYISSLVLSALWSQRYIIKIKIYIFYIQTCRCFEVSCQCFKDQQEKRTYPKQNFFTFENYTFIEKITWNDKLYSIFTIINVVKIVQVKIFFLLFSPFFLENKCSLNKCRLLVDKSYMLISVLFWRFFFSSELLNTNDTDKWRVLVAWASWTCRGRWRRQRPGGTVLGRPPDYRAHNQQ